MTQTPQVPTIAQKTAGMQPLPGYFNLYWDAGQGQLWLEVTRLGDEFLYQSGLAAGIGSNDIGMDRSAVGGTHIVRLERMGAKILLIAENFRHRSISEDENERRAVRDSFAESLNCVASYFQESINIVSSFMHYPRPILGILGESGRGENHGEEFLL